MSGKSALIGICLLLVAGAGAGGYLWLERRAAPRDPAGERTLPPLEFGRGRGLSYTFVDTGGALQTVGARDDVPEDAREIVKVTGAIVRRTDRTASLVYVADLRVQSLDGGFPYKVMTEAQFNELVLPQSSDTTMRLEYEPETAPPPAPPVKKPRGKGAKPKAAPLPEIVRGPQGLPGHESGARSAEPSGLAPARAGGKSVVLYTTAWCPACTQARTWFRQRGVPFVERDIEKDRQADREYALQCARIGQPPGRVPGIEIDGRLMIGFAPGRVESLLRR